MQVDVYIRSSYHDLVTDVAVARVPTRALASLACVRTIICPKATMALLLLMSQLMRPLLLTNGWLPLIVSMRAIWFTR
jgi:hypothetical protein